MPNRLTTPEKQQALQLELDNERAQKAEFENKKVKKKVKIDPTKRSEIAHVHSSFVPTDLKEHIIRNYQIDHIYLCEHADVTWSSSWRTRESKSVAC